MDLLTNKPTIKSIKDFGENDRIALPSIKVSIQAIVLAMGVEKAFGPGKWNALDNIEVAMAHPEAGGLCSTHEPRGPDHRIHGELPVPGARAQAGRHLQSHRL